MKTKEHFQPYIDAKEATIAEIKCNRNFSEEQKNQLLNSLRNDIAKLQRLQVHYAMLELRKTKQRQLIKIRNYETMVN